MSHSGIWNCVRTLANGAVKRGKMQTQKAHVMHGSDWITHFIQSFCDLNSLPVVNIHLKFAQAGSPPTALDIL